MELSDLRRDFGKQSLDETKMLNSPIDLFLSWLEEAKATLRSEFNAMVLSTVGQMGTPSSRIVLLKEITDSGGMVFYSNYRSRKALDLKANPNAALLFFWAPLERQVRIEGRIRKLSAEKSDKYFYSRPFESQLSAIVSPQSETVKELSVLNKKRKILIETPQNVKRPEYWGGYELQAEMFEFWQGGQHRMHDRIRYRLKEGNWRRDRLAP